LVTLVEEAAIVSALAGTLLAFFAVMQFRHLEKHRNVEISMKLFEWAETDKLRKAFKWLDKKCTFTTYKDYKTFEETDNDACEYPVDVIEFFEQVGFLVSRNFVDLDVVVDRLGGYIVFNWQKLAPLVAGVRKEKNDATYGEHFEHLYMQTVTHLNKHKNKKRVLLENC
jgi:hypothetical protein